MTTADPSAKPVPTSTTPLPPSPRRPRMRRALAVAAGVAMVPALYAVANAASGGSDGPAATVAAASRSADDRGTETEIEHGVEVQKPHGGATTPSVPEVTSPTTPQATTPATPQATTPTAPEQEIEHPVPEPGDDNGVDAPGDDDGDGNRGSGGAAVTPVPTGTQAFSSVGGSIVVAVNGSSISLASSNPAAGFGAEVHDNGPTRVEVRFFGTGTNGGTEWRIRVELGSGGLTSEVSQHG
jgi:hypothetical protein